jgi:hypothetical protein
MDINGLSQGFSLIGSAISALKQAKSLLPDNSKKNDIAVVLERAEHEFKEAEIIFAKTMGYEFCKKHFPPEIMLEDETKHWYCQQFSIWNLGIPPGS